MLHLLKGIGAIVALATCISVHAAPFKPQEKLPLGNYLTTPATNAVKQIPVLMITYLPTTDGTSLNATETGSSESLTSKLTQINTFAHYTKFMLEEASRFRGYRFNRGEISTPVTPYLGYKIIDHIVIYDQMPRGNEVPWKLGQGVFRPDYIKILNDQNITHYVNNLGVKEVWIWGYHHGVIEPTESNMSSPTTGDISNSEGTEDLPILNKTYVVYNYNYNRSGNEAVHNHGHQLEAIMKFVNNRQDGNQQLINTLWELDRYSSSGETVGDGRLGNTHFPINARLGYDYHSPMTVVSDIEHIDPQRPEPLSAADPATIAANLNTWASINYHWPTEVPEPSIAAKEEAHWYIYWLQNSPGMNNSIPYQTGRVMSNWWQFTDDWDTAITSGAGLHQASNQIPANLPKLSIRGTNNNWVPTAMTLSAANKWTTNVTFPSSTTNRFKFDVHGDWTHNYGDNNGDKIAERSGNDILITQGAGNYDISFNDQTLAYTVTKVNQPNQSPVANAGADINVVVGETFTLNGSNSTDPDGQIVSYNWSTGSSGVTVSSSFASVGTFTITLTVTDNMGATASDQIQVTVNPASQNWKRTVVFIFGQTQSGQDMFIRGGLDHGFASSQLGKQCTSTNFQCAIPIQHNNLLNQTTAPWKSNDTFLDWYGTQIGQSTSAQGTPLDWTTNNWPSTWGTVKQVSLDGFGLTPLNVFGMHYWMLDVNMNCSATHNGWFEIKSFISNGPGWEGDVSQLGAPYASGNHFAKCGQLNVFQRGVSQPVTITPLN